MKRMMLVPEGNNLPATEQAGRVELYNTDRNVLKQVSALDYIEFILKNSILPPEQKMKLVETAIQALIVGKEQGKGGSVDSATGKSTIINRTDTSNENGFSSNDLPLIPQASSKKSRSRRSLASTSVGHDSGEIRELHAGMASLTRLGFSINDKNELVYKDKAVEGSDANHMLKFFSNRLTNDQAPVGLDETLSGMNDGISRAPSESSGSFKNRKKEMRSLTTSFKKQAKKLKQSGAGLKTFLIPQPVGDLSRTRNLPLPKITRPTLAIKPRNLRKDIVTQWQLLRKN